MPEYRRFRKQCGNLCLYPTLILTLLFAAGCASLWNIDNLNSIGGHKITVVGSPGAIKTPSGRAVEFDGVDDALFMNVHPLKGAKAFTAEIIFCPYENGPKEQRFFHIQEEGSENRIMFETRLTDDNQWFLDTFIHSQGGNYTLYAEDFKHPVGAWYQAAIVVDGNEMRHYVNGVKEISREINFLPQGEGKTSIGARINKVHWYKGAIRKARFTTRVLSPEEFLKP